MITVATNNLFEKLQQVKVQIGNTPLLPVLGLHKNPKVKIYAKAEWQQLSGSIKARAAFNIISNAIHTGNLDENKVLLDATSGNTGIAYAAIAKHLGLKVTLLLPENATAERKALLRTLVAEIIYTSKFGGTDEAQQIATEMALNTPDKYFYASQYSNSNNWKAHYNGTALEINDTLPYVDYFVAGLGTTGTFVGTAKRLKELNPNIVNVALQPDIALHGLEGWKHLETAIVPRIYEPELVDSIVELTTENVYEFIKKIHSTIGWLLSPSAAANLLGAVTIANKMEAGNVVTVLTDNADKYHDLITKLFKNNI